MKDLLIVGSGPAGISAALYAVRGGAPVTVVAKDGGALAKAELIQNYYGFANGIAAKDLYAAGLKQAENLGAKILHTEIFGIEFAEEGFRAKTAAGALNAGAVVLACGAARNVPPIRNIGTFEGAGVSYCAICDAFFYRGKKVAVVGGGAYARSEYAELKNVVGDVTVLTDGGAALDGIPCNTKKIATSRAANGWKKSSLRTERAKSSTACSSPAARQAPSSLPRRSGWRARTENLLSTSGAQRTCPASSRRATASPGCSRSQRRSATA